MTSFYLTLSRVVPGLTHHLVPHDTVPARLGGVARSPSRNVPVSRYVRPFSCLKWGKSTDIFGCSRTLSRGAIWRKRQLDCMNIRT